MTVDSVSNLFENSQATLQNLETTQSSLSSAANDASTTDGVPFAGVFHSLVNETQQLETNAQTAVAGLMHGTGVELHEAMIATQKADMAFELALQVRNKAVASYQQMMSMQF